MLPRPPFDIRERSFQFGCRVVRFCRGLTVTYVIERHLRAQLLAAGTSIGANLQEAKAAASRRDFIAKNAIALKEAREALYWLRLAETCDGGDPKELADLIKEADELVAILTSIVKTARRRLAEPI
jgi:four helix bundle protein